MRQRGKTIRASYTLALPVKKRKRLILILTSSLLNYIFLCLFFQRDNTLNSIQALTKFVPRVGEMSRKIVEGHIDKSITKMGVARLDCLQLHWWDYSDKRYMDALKHLSALQSEGKIGK